MVRIDQIRGPMVVFNAVAFCSSAIDFAQTSKLRAAAARSVQKNKSKAAFIGKASLPRE